MESMLYCLEHTTPNTAVSSTEKYIYMSVILEEIDVIAGYLSFQTSRVMG